MSHGRGRSPLSLMSQTFARRAFVVFFLASVVPLAVLAFLGEEYVIPQLGSGLAATGVTAAMVLSAVLALLAFAVLSRAARDTIQEVRGQNQRLTILVQATQALSDQAFTDDIARQTLQAGTGLASARAGVLFLEPATAGPAPAAPFEWGEGAEGVLASQARALAELAAAAKRTGTPVLGQDAGRSLAAPVLAHGRTFGALAVVREASDEPFSPRDLELVGSLARQAGIAVYNARLQESEKNFFTHVTGLLVEALDRFAIHQPGHSRRVAYYSGSVGRALGLGPPRLERLFFAALLHDIGILRLPSAQAVGREHYEEHPALGHQMIGPITTWSDLAPMILHHHERYDGQGYPAGLAGEEIPLESRIIGLAEAFDAMTSPSSYRPWRPAAEAILEIEQLAGAQFDPKAAAALAELVRQGEIETPSS